MEENRTFLQTVLQIAFPVTMQSLLQSSFSVADQIMIGQLGSSSIAGIGLGGKFASLYSVVLAAVASAAGIMVSQYLGRKDGPSAVRSFYANLAWALGLGAMFSVPCIVFPETIMALYTKDIATRRLAVTYIRILAVSFLPMAASSVMTAMLRCMEAASLPLYASILALVCNTGLNYLLIFGKWVFPKMGVEGAAWASVAAQGISCVAILFFFLRHKKWREYKWGVGMDAQKAGCGMRGTGLEGRREKACCKEEGRRLQRRDPESEAIGWRGDWKGSRGHGRQYLGILCPLLVCEFLWSLGENVYTAIYGNIGTDACAAMTVTIPVQTIVIGALCGLSQASGILVGKSLGAKQYGQAYAEAKKLMGYGLVASALLSFLLIILCPYYVKIYSVGPSVQGMARSLLTVIALIAPVKVLNMILGGGILRSGGKTKYTMWIDIIGTWGFGVPLGLLAAFVWKLPIAYVYFVLSLEECVRLGISLIIFRKKTWMESIR